MTELSTQSPTATTTISPSNTRLQRLQRSRAARNNINNSNCHTATAATTTTTTAVAAAATIPRRATPSASSFSDGIASNGTPPPPPISTARATRRARGASNNAAPAKIASTTSTNGNGGDSSSSSARCCLNNRPLSTVQKMTNDRDNIRSNSNSNTTCTGNNSMSSSAASMAPTTTSLLTSIPKGGGERGDGSWFQYTSGTASATSRASSSTLCASSTSRAAALRSPVAGGARTNVDVSHQFQQQQHQQQQQQQQQASVQSARTALQSKMKRSPSPPTHYHHSTKPREEYAVQNLGPNNYSFNNNSNSNNNNGISPNGNIGECSNNTSNSNTNTTANTTNSKIISNPSHYSKSVSKPQPSHSSLYTTTTSSPPSSSSSTIMARSNSSLPLKNKTCLPSSPSSLSKYSSLPSSLPRSSSSSSSLLLYQKQSLSTIHHQQQQHQPQHQQQQYQQQQSKHESNTPRPQSMQSRLADSPNKSTFNNSNNSNKSNNSNSHNPSYSNDNQHHHHHHRTHHHQPSAKKTSFNYIRSHHRQAGTPIWIHASILMDSNNDMCVEKNGNGNGNGRRMMSSMNNASCCVVNKEWGWHRGFLHLNGDDSVAAGVGSVGNNNIGASSLHRSSSSTMSITIDDPSSPSHHGNTYTIPQKYNDGTHLLMANSWWSSPPSPSSPPLQTLQPQQQQPMPPGDLVELTHLHEPAIVHALQCRYERDEIYTNTGAILLALNPFKKLDHLYTREMMEMYWCGGDDEEDEGRASREMEEEEEEGEEKGKERGRKQEKPPHAYAVAERAFSSMLRSLEERDISSVSLSGYGNGKDDMEHAPCNQSILVSGESGAGKTVTTKIIMRYLAILSQRRMVMARNATTAAAKETSHNGDGLSVETQVLQSNPVLESFGNARTIRNDNSSRFGKFIEMSFQARKDGNSGSGGRGTLLGASIYFYLLEKVRLVSVNSGERNYHIFYEMLSCAGMDLAERRQYKLTSNFGSGRSLLSVNDFKMTCMSGTFDRRDGVDDADTYRELRMAMDTVGFSSEDQGGIFSIVSALLHASNLRFIADGGQNLGSEGCTIYDRDGTCEAVSSLLGVSEESLQMALTASAIEARGERLIKKLSVGQAEKALEALTKATYAALFAYIVKRINKSIEVHGSSDEGASGTNISGSVATIGVLDIFGFESFENNSFEQLCINYCNEALQQQFNRFVFKAEQAEYEREGIVWSNIDFPDNQEALDLIEDRRLGVFSVLDEQCRLPRCTDKTFSSAVYDKCESNSYFAASRMQKSEGRFVIVHYAGEVEYDSSGFLLKNKDELPKGASDLLASSSIPLIAELACILNNSNSTPAVSSGEGSRGSIKRSSSSITHSTVCGQFASQLRDLRSRIAGTGPHYIRCLKPNDRLIADDFDESLIAHQLNCAGVLPAMKLARAGFAMRYLHSAFIQRFRLIVSQELAQRSSTRSYHRSLNCQTLINLLSQRLESEMKRKHHPNTNAQESDDIVSWGVQIGKTKVFLRVTAFDALETLRNSTLNAAATKLQAQARSFLCQRSFFLTLGSILTLQCGARKMIATVLVRQLRFNLRSITIQKQWRSYSAWSSYQNMLFISVWCQRLWRGGKVREKFVVIKQYRSSIKIQSFWRSHVFQVCYRQQRIAAISIQCFLRVLLANKVFGQLRREAKDLQHVALERDTLRQEMQQMKRELEQVKLHNGIVGIGPDSSHDYISCSRHAEPHLSTPTHCVDSGSSSQNENSDEKIRLLHRECAKKDRELRILRKEIESLRGSGRSISSTLPSTVTVDTALPSSRSSRFSPLFSPFGFAKFHPLEDAASPRELDFQSSPNLLDTEIVDLSESECPQISNPDNSFEFNGAKGSLSSFNLASEFLLNDCDDADELPYHRAVRNNDKAMLLNEIKKSSDIDFDVNSADSKGRTPLHIAVQCSNKELVQQLLLNNAVVNTQDFAGNTALHYAESPDLTQVLLDGGNNPNIPNGEGLCSLHLAVKRKDFMSVKCLLSHGANVNNADDEYWYTPLHLVAHADTFSTPPSTDKSTSVRGPIAELLCETTVPSIPDLNYQDRDGNTPLHHAASLVEEDAGILISLFIEHGSSPKIANNRGQTPLHLFCHNDLARRFVFYHEALHLMLACGADPNQASLSGCTALHLALYHQDIEAAALLVRHGAQLNSKWRKPMKWEVFWTDMGSEDVLPLDMLENVSMLHAVLKEISTPQIAANHRSKCMNCKEKFRVFGRHHNCMHCGRSVCGHCTPGSLNSSFFPTGRKEDDTRNGLMKVCVLCESILLSRAETGNITNNATMSVAGEEIVCDSTSIGTISM